MRCLSYGIFSVCELGIILALLMRLICSAYFVQWVNRFQRLRCSRSLISFMFVCRVVEKSAICSGFFFCFFALNLLGWLHFVLFSPLFGFGENMMLVLVTVICFCFSGSFNRVQLKMPEAETALNKIVKPGGKLPDELEKQVSNALADLEATSDIKAALRELYIVGAKVSCLTVIRFSAIVLYFCRTMDFGFCALKRILMQILLLQA